MVMRVCSVHGCPTIYDGTESRCPTHRAEAEKAHSHRGKAYKTRGHRIGFREAVLRRDPICVICGVVQSEVADHYPLSRIELIEAGLDPNDPQYGRGLCARDHNRETAIHQPGGWNNRE